MIFMLMKSNKKSARSLKPAGKILIGLLALCALVFLSLSGWYGCRVFSRRNTPSAVKEESRSRARGFSKILSNSVSGDAVLRQTQDAGREYTDETLFLGDSNTVRFMTFLDSDGMTFTNDQNTIAVVGMGAEGITSVACEQFSIGTFTMRDAVSIIQPRRIIMTFGTNNLDSELMTAELFIENYELQVQAVEEAYPYADIIINSIPPLGQYSHYPKLNMEQVREFNSAILKMCEKNGWKYLNSSEALTDSTTGFAKAEYIEADGVHYNVFGIEAMFRYIRTHALISEDRRPMPLEEVPYIIGPVTEIYTVDPLSNQEFSAANGYVRRYGQCGNRSARRAF